MHALHNTHNAILCLNTHSFRDSLGWLVEFFAKFQPEVQLSFVIIVELNLDWNSCYFMVISSVVWQRQLLYQLKKPDYLLRTCKIIRSMYTYMQ